MHVIEFPWPHSTLHSNSRKLWAVKAGVVRNARSMAYYLCKEAKVPTIEGAVIEFAYHPKDKRRRDCQNIPHSLKAYIDGIADAMGCDDHNFRIRYPDQFSEIRKPGVIIAKISPPVVSVPIVGEIS